MSLLWLVFILSSSVQAAEPSDTPVVETSSFIQNYDAIRVALVKDQLDQAKTAAQALLALSTGNEAIHSAASAVAASPDLTSCRKAFSDLSRVLILALSSSSPKIVVYHCPMYQGFGWWIQQTSGVANPYMGTMMPECGEEVSLKAAARAAALP